MKKSILIITVIAAAMMELIDTSIVNVALSHMSGNLGATLEDTSWVITAYAIANIIIIPMTSFLTNKLGRRNYYIGSIIAFTFFSAMCGLSSNIWTLVAFRFLQGMGGGALLSVSQAIVFEVYGKEKQGIAAALFGIGVFLGPTIGPTLGGFITENYSWPWIFYINIPIGIAVTVSSLLLITEPAIKTKVQSVDWWGILLLSVGVGSLQTVLERGETDDWFAANYIIVLTVLAILSIILFIWWELKTPHPVIDLRVLTSKTLSIAAILTFITGFGLFTSVFLTPVVAQRVLNFPPTITGLMLLPGAILAIFGLMFSASLLKKGVSPLIIITVGFVLFIIFNWQMSRMNLNSGPADIATSLIYRALGLALLTVPLTALAVSELEAKDVPQGAALNNMMRQLGGSFGIAIINTYVANRFGLHRSDLLANVNIYNAYFTERINKLTQYFLGRGNSIFDAQKKAIAVINSGVDRQSFLLSYLDAYLFTGLLFLVAMPLLLLVIKRKKQSRPVVLVSDH
ncbi:DHA2 family efflux MFS transporter permease subunit [Mucilaginibacter sabulilitoris]|uniref:DHA2 family efflux MFS transporter permease subunit n=1 Tax=Mucilaginibacter sabulilitoris TaxID=1173583 RepID=A0ABZ0THZ7_9SPHI|nr:DHA2 family efflux MFS transporter permease subunit [Mucilaginibacter sabulilitoris]WPU92653.1 DHA2 family efflux MFS transporter permease subunit [Mucilaginibacter sabulilitoris]